MPAQVHAVIKAKGGHTKYYDILKFMYIFQSYNFSLKLFSWCYHLSWKSWYYIQNYLYEST